MMKRKIWTIMALLFAVSAFGAMEFSVSHGEKGSNIEKRNEKENAVIKHDNGYDGNSVGTNGAGEWVCASRYTESELAAYYGNNLTTVKIMLKGEDYSSVKVKVWEDGSFDGTVGNPGTELYTSENLKSLITPEVWLEHQLPTAIALESGKEYWLGYELVATGGFPSAADQGPMVDGKGAWMGFMNEEGTAYEWSQLNALSATLNYNWMIRGVLDCDGIDQEGPQVELISKIKLVSPETATEVKAKITDATGVKSAELRYTIEGGSEQTVAMVAGANDEYTAEIPGQVKDVKASYKIVAVDDMPTENSSESAVKELEWTTDKLLSLADEYTATLWYGPSTPYGAALDFDLGTENNYKVKYIKTRVDTISANSWKVVNFSGEPQTDALGTLSGTFSTTEENETVTIDLATDQTLINGKIAVVLENQGISPYYCQTDLVNSSHAWLFAEGALPWTQLSTVAGFERVWYIEARFIEAESGIEFDAVPGTVTLEQNYPNPFNPSTTISFFNNASGKVNLSVFNTKGELVKTLINKEMSATSHNVEFDARGLNSGVYYYTLKTPLKTLTKKMILVK